MKKSLFLALIIILFLISLPINAEVIDGKFCPTSANSISNSKSIDKLVGHFDNQIKVVFSDIDGTLIPLDKSIPKGTVPDSVKEGVKKLQQAKIPMILATGRPASEAKLFAIKMGNENTYLIGQQGAEIMDPSGKIIFKDCINNKDAKKILKEINYFNKSNNQDSKIIIYMDEEIYTFEKFKIPYLIKEPIVVNSKFTTKPSFIPFKIEVYENNPEKLRAIQSYLKKELPNYNVQIAADCFCTIYNSSVSKGSAVKKLAKILKTDLKNAAVFGDAENDVSMLKLLKQSGGLSVAVENALPPVKESANYITNPVNKDGFAKAVDKILENNKDLTLVK